MSLEYEAFRLCCQYGGGVCVGRGVTEPLGLDSRGSDPNSESDVVVGLSMHVIDARGSLGQ